MTHIDNKERQKPPWSNRTFDLVLPKSIQEVVLNMTNKEGRRVYGNKWRKMDRIDLEAYVGMQIFAGV